MRTRRRGQPGGQSVDVAAQMELLKLRLDRVGAAPQAPAAVVLARAVAAGVADELDRRERAAAAAEAARVRESFRGAPCLGCGQTRSWAWQDYAGEHGTAAVRTVAEAKWYPAFGGVVCLECHLDRGSGITVDDFKGWVARCLLGDEGRYWLPQALAARLVGVPVLWAEHTPRPATREGDAPLVARFAFVDVGRIVEAAYRSEGPDLYRGPACESCGATGEWTMNQPGLGARLFGAEMMLPAHEECHGCGYRRALGGGPLRAEVPAPPVDPGTERALAAFRGPDGVGGLPT